MSQVSYSRCLICYTEMPKSSTDSGGGGLLMEDLHVIFVLRTLFEVPVETLQQYLIRQGNPSEWNMLGFCDRCGEAVGNAKGIYQEIVEASRIFAAVKGEIVETVRRSCRRHRKENGWRVGDVAEMGRKERFTELTRDFIFNHPYGPSSDPYVEGDRMAKDKLLKPPSKTKTVATPVEKVIKTEPATFPEPPPMQRFDPAKSIKQEPLDNTSNFLQEPNDLEVDVPQTVSSAISELFLREWETKVRTSTSTTKKVSTAIQRPRKAPGPLSKTQPTSNIPVNVTVPPAKIIATLRKSKYVYACHYPKCLKSYATRGGLTHHLMYHRGEKPYKCNWPNCFWRFARKDTLTRHYIVNHQPNRQWRCRFCGMEFNSRRDYLRKHFKEKHPEEVKLVGDVKILMKDAEANFTSQN